VTGGQRTAKRDILKLSIDLICILSSLNHAALKIYMRADPKHPVGSIKFFYRKCPGGSRDMQNSEWWSKDRGNTVRIEIQAKKKRGAEADGCVLINTSGR
jgi:hypothetical protein